MRSPKPPPGAPPLSSRGRGPNVKRAAKAAKQARKAEAAERAIADYRVIESVAENAALAERALEATESEDDYAEAWKRHREATRYTEAVLAIALQAELLVVSARDNANKADEWAREAEAYGEMSHFPGDARGVARKAVENADEIAALRAQLEG